MFDGGMFDWRYFQYYYGICWTLPDGDMFVNNKLHSLQASKNNSSQTVGTFKNGNFAV
jgi:hypothetical protein